MSNWCSNVLTITGLSKDLKRFKKEVQGCKAEYFLNEQERKMFSSVKEKHKSILSLNKLCPIPRNILKKGYNDAGYNWQVENWGTKWDLGEDIEFNESDRKLEYSFDTAWTPPMKAILAGSKKYPMLTFVLDYEEFSSCFGGGFECEAGKIVHDNHDWKSIYFRSTGGLMKTKTFVIQLGEHVISQDVDIKGINDYISAKLDEKMTTEEKQGVKNMYIRINAEVEVIYE